MKAGFQLDLNRCTGCEACVLACTVENRLGWGTSWRRVGTFNAARHPAAPVFHLSLACNHCVEPPCADACPALAYSRDARTGLVRFDARRCIGCRYCTWACPYDAPRYDSAAGVVAKCTSCDDRLAEGLAPACVVACPTRALTHGPSEELDGVRNVPGFPRTNAQPSIRFVALREDRAQPVLAAGSVEPFPVEAITPAPVARRSRIGMRREWPLAVFTLAAAVLVAWWTAAATAAVTVRAAPFAVLAVASVSLAGFHLGRAARAWRAVFNLRRSWLSREIFLFGAFVCLAIVASIRAEFAGGIPIAVVGFAALFAIDRVYDVVRPPGEFPLHSSDATITGLFLSGILQANGLLAGTVGAVKLALYAGRRVGPTRSCRRTGPATVAARCLLGFALPALAWFAAPERWELWAAAAALAGEFVDRTEFYEELAIVTPDATIASDLRAVVAASRAAG